MIVLRKIILLLLVVTSLLISVAYAQDVKEQPRCRDTDGGLNIYDRGTVFEVTSTGDISHDDICIGKTGIREFACHTRTQELVTVEYRCLYGCNDGKCAKEYVKGSSILCSETDNGYDPDHNGVLTATIENPKEHQIQVEDNCLDDKQLVESYCIEPEIIGDTPYDSALFYCQHGCVDSKCISSLKPSSNQTPIIKSVSISKNPIKINETLTTKANLNESLEQGICKLFINSIGADDFLYTGDPNKGCNEAIIPSGYLENFDIQKSGEYSLEWHYFPPGCESSTLPCFSLEAVTLKVIGESSEQPTTSQIENILNDLESLRNDIIDKSEELSNKPLRNVANKLARPLDLIQDALEKSSNGNIEKCNNNLERSVKALDNVLNYLEQRLCRGTIKSKRCISKEVFETYSPLLEDLFNSLDEEISVDNDDNGISDACDFGLD